MSNQIAMKKTMLPIEVEVSGEGRILVTQDDYGDGGSSILITPDQVDTLIQWLTEAKATAEKAKADFLANYTAPNPRLRGK